MATYTFTVTAGGLSAAAQGVVAGDLQRAAKNLVRQVIDSVGTSVDPSISSATVAVQVS